MHIIIWCDELQAQDVNFAMEASRKSRIAFAAANVNMAEAKYGESISSIKRALDFNFQDVDGLLRLVRLAMEVISRWRLQVVVENFLSPGCGIGWLSLEDVIRGQPVTSARLLDTSFGHCL